jgi:hypothetical protein
MLFPLGGVEAPALVDMSRDEERMPLSRREAFSSRALSSIFRLASLIRNSRRIVVTVTPCPGVVMMTLSLRQLTGTGTRNKLGADFLRDLAASYRESGPGILRDMSSRSSPLDRIVIFCPT